MTGPIERFSNYNEPIGQHYSNKGGHKARHDFWNAMRKMDPQHVPTEAQWLIRRNMFRDPRSGR